MKTCQESWSEDRDINPGAPKYKSGVPMIDGDMPLTSLRCVLFCLHKRFQSSDI
jgi:hypothetical protein